MAEYLTVEGALLVMFVGGVIVGIFLASLDALVDLVVRILRLKLSKEKNRDEK